MDQSAIHSIEHWITSRRTVNLFDSQPAPKDLLLKAIDTARWSPNHRLTEPWRFLLIGASTASKVVELGVEIARETKSEAAAVARRKRLEAIPGWFAVVTSKSEDPILHQEDYAACCCAVQNLSLCLWEKGVGVKWTSGALTRDPRLFSLLDLNPDEEYLVGLFWYGYPKLIPKAQDRKPLADIVTQLP